MFRLWDSLTHDESIPLSISPQNQMDRLRSTFYWAMQFDLEEVPQLLGHNEMFLLLMQIAVFPVLPELDRVPAVRFLEARETNTRNAILLGCKKTLKRLRETVGKHLHRRRWDVFTLSFESFFQLILAGECPILLIVCLDRLKHVIVNGARLTQALHEQMGLLLIRIQTILKCSHEDILLETIRIVKRGRCALRWRPFIPIAEARGPLAALR